MAAPNLPIANGGDGVQAPVLDWANGQMIVVAGSSAQSAALTAVGVTLISDTDCYIKWGSNPTAAAAAGNAFLAAGIPFGLGINPGLIAVIQKSAGGNLFILPWIEV